MMMSSLIRAGPKRDLRVDLARGLALLFIFVDHIPGNVLGSYTLRNFSLADATEAFVLLAGYAAGLTYGASADARGWIFAAADAVRRAATLYVAHILVLVIVTAQVGYSAQTLNPVYVEEMLLNPFASDPYRALLEALLLRYQPNLLNILPLYVILLLMMAGGLALRRRPGLLLGLSFLIYGAARHWELNFPNWIDGGWFLNPLTWQLLFFIGCVLGYSPSGRPAVPMPRHWAMTAGALLVSGLCAGIVLAFLALPVDAAGLQGKAARILMEVDKTGLHPLRLLSILSLAYLVARFVPRHAAWLRGPAASPLILMGQQGLPVFCAGIMLSFMGRIALEYHDDAAGQIAVNLTGFLALLVTAVVSAWYQRKGRADAAARSAPVAPKRIERRPATIDAPMPARQST